MSKPPNKTQSPKTLAEPTASSRRKRARLERLLGEAMDSIEQGERRVGSPDVSVHLSTHLRRGGVQ